MGSRASTNAVCWFKLCSLHQHRQQAMRVPHLLALSRRPRAVVFCTRILWKVVGVPSLCHRQTQSKQTKSGADADADSDAQRMAFTLLLQSSLETTVTLAHNAKWMRTCRGCWSSLETGGWRSSGHHPFTASCRTQHTHAKLGTPFCVRHEVTLTPSPVLL